MNRNRFLGGGWKTGPLSPNRALDTVIQGMSGLMSVTGFADREPVRVGASISDMMSGMCKQLSPPTFESPCPVAVKSLNGAAVRRRGQRHPGRAARS